MGDQIDNNQDDAGAGDSQAAVDDKSTDTGGQDGAGSDDKGDNAGGNDDKGAQKADDDDVEPGVRKKTPQEYIIDRQRRKLQKQQAAAKDDKNGKADDDSDEDDDDDISPEDERVVDKVIQKKYGDRLAKLDQADDKAELQTFLSENKDFAPYEKKIWKFMQHPSRSHLPIKTIAFEVAGDDLMKLGAKRAAEADHKAKQTSAGGNSNRGTGGGKADYASMTDAEILAQGEAIKRSRS